MRRYWIGFLVVVSIGILRADARSAPAFISTYSNVIASASDDQNPNDIEMQPPSGFSFREQKFKDNDFDKAVRKSLKNIAFAAMKYHATHGYHYPIELDSDFKNAMPGGDGASQAGPGIYNPSTDRNELPSVGTMEELIQAQRGNLHMAPGSWEYIPFHNGQSFAVIGGREDGSAMVLELRGTQADFTR